MGGLDRKWRTDAPKPRRRVGWEEQEAQLPQLQPGGAVQRGSGNGRRASAKGDGTGKHFLVSAKTTEDPGQKGLRVERGWLEEITQQARALTPPKHPALLLGFDRDDGRPREDWLALPIQTQQALIDIAVAAHRGDDAEARALAGLLFGERRV